MTPIDDKVVALPRGTLGGPYTIVERGGRSLISSRGSTTQYVAELSPYNPNARVYAESMVAAANAERELRAALRLLHACADRFQTAPSVRSWRDLSAARGVARDLLVRLGG